MEASQNAQNNLDRERIQYRKEVDDRKSWITPEKSLMALYLFLKSPEIDLLNLGYSLIFSDSLGLIKDNYISNHKVLPGIIIAKQGEPNQQVIIIPGKEIGIEVQAFNLPTNLEEIILDWGGPVWVREDCTTQTQKERMRVPSNYKGFVKRIRKEGGQNG